MAKHNFETCNIKYYEGVPKFIKQYKILGGNRKNYEEVQKISREYRKS